MRLTTRPGKPAVRWTMIAVAAAVLVAVPVVAQIQFSDVPSDNPHRDDINYVAGERWFVGFRDATFKPDQNITPAQMTRVLTRAFEDGITRAEFASFMVAGNEWQQRIKETSGYRRWAPGEGKQLLAVGDDISPGRIRILGTYNERYCSGYVSPIWSDECWQARWTSRNIPWSYRTRYDGACRWMRLGYIPDGGQNFDTIAATDAPIAGYFQGEYTREPHIIRIEPTDTAFMIECLGEQE